MSKILNKSVTYLWFFLWKIWKDAIVYINKETI